MSMTEEEVRRLMEENDGTLPVAEVVRLYGQDAEDPGEVTIERPGKARGLLSSLMQGVTFGFSDEIGAGVKALPRLAPGGQSFGEAYSQNVEAAREGLESTREDMPVASTVADVAGSVAPIVAGTVGSGGTATPGMLSSLLGRVGGKSVLRRAATEGATFGALEGAGRAEGGIGNRALAGGIGAGLGAGLGAGGQAVLRAGSTATGAALGGGAAGINELREGDPLGAGDAAKVGGGVLAGAGTGRLAGRAAGRLSEMVRGANPVQSIRERAAGRLSRSLEREGIDPSDLASTVEGRPPGMTLLDIGEEGGPLQRLGRVTETVGGEGSTNLRRSLSQRSDESLGMLQESLQKRSGLTFEDATKTVDDIIAQRSEAAAPLYRAAYEDAVPMSDDLATLLQKPSVQRAFERAQRIAAEEGEEIAPIGAIDDLGEMGVEAGTVEGLESIPIKTIDYIKRGLDDMLSVGRRGGGGGLGPQEVRAIQQTKDRLLSIADDASESFAQARATWGGSKQAQDAFEAAFDATTARQQFGIRKFTSESPERIQAALRKMTPTQREMYQRGALDAVREKLARSSGTGEVGSTRNLARVLLGNSDMTKKIKLLFNSTEDYDGFIRDALDVGRMTSQTPGFVGAGSRTTPLAEDISDFRGEGFSFMDLLRRPTQAAGDFAERRLMGVDEATADALSPMLTTPLSEGSPQILRELEEFIRREQQRQGATRLLTGGAAAGAGVGSAALFGSSTQERQP